MFTAVAAVAAFAALAGTPAAADADNLRLTAEGQRIYRDGILPDGSRLQGMTTAGAVLSGKLAACETCHRRSGMGSREGQLIVAPITGPILARKTEFHWPTRPGRPQPDVQPMRLDSREAYDDARLARAIRDGIDPSDRPLALAMPRYALADDAMRALAAYLWQLSATTDPGLDGAHIELATIVTPDADPVRRQVVVDALTAWAADRRPDALAPGLQVWQLVGDPAGWREQLEALYRARPVFAVLSGAGGSQWEPVRGFCEARSLPCLFPIVDAAVSQAGDPHALFFDTGVVIEAAIVAQHLADAEPPPRRVVQVFDSRAGGAGAIGAAGLAARLAAQLPGMPVAAVDWSADPAASVASAAPAASGGPSASAELPPELKTLTAGDLLVAWLPPTALNRLIKRLGPAEGFDLIASARLSPPEASLAAAAGWPAAWQQRVRWVSTRSDPTRRHGNAVIGLVPWLNRLGLAPADEAVQAEVYAATYFFGDALARMRAPRSRDYLIEMIESTVFNRPAGSAFYALSLGPGQRVAVKGGHLLGLAPPDYRRIAPVGPRIVPAGD